MSAVERVPLGAEGTDRSGFSRRSSRRRSPTVFALGISCLISVEMWKCQRWSCAPIKLALRPSIHTPPPTPPKNTYGVYPPPAPPLVTPTVLRPPLPPPTSSLLEKHAGGWCPIRTRAQLPAEHRRGAISRFCSGGPAATRRRYTAEVGAGQRIAGRKIRAARPQAQCWRYPAGPSLPSRPRLDGGNLPAAASRKGGGGRCRGTPRIAAGAAEHSTRYAE